MRKYSIYNIYVVEIQNDNDIHYLICKHNKLSDIYVEIFTNDKIKVTNNLMVKPLSSFYSILAQYNYTAEKTLMLNKKELLKIYITINDEASLKKRKILPKIKDNIIESNSILEKATLNFFPKEGVWYSYCFRRPKDLEIGNLPCHLRDDLWLAKMIKKDQKLFYISTNKILQFVKTSPFFQEKRHEYEQEIVKWQIDWMINDGENWIADEKYGGDIVFLTPVCDLGFRKGVVDTLSRIGINLDAIEEGIEKNANMWRDSFMNRAFHNKYDPILLDFRAYLRENDESIIKKGLDQVDLEFKEKWLKLRKYEYYQKHKDSVDKYGIVEPDMILSNEEVAELKIYLEQKHNERMMQIEQYKQEKYETTEQPKVLTKI